MPPPLNLRALTQSYRAGKLHEVRRTLWTHLDAGKKLNPDGYSLLLSAFDRGKPDARLEGLLDDRMAVLGRPGGPSTPPGCRCFAPAAAAPGTRSRCATSTPTVRPRA